MADWQRGYDLEVLKEWAGPFRRHHAPICFGAFTLTKENEIAAAAVDGRLLHTKTPAPAVALTRRLAIGSKFTDLAGNVEEMPRGAIVVDAIAGDEPAAVRKLLDHLAVRARDEAAPLYAKVMEEDAITKAAIQEAGMSWLTSKVAAGSEVIGLYVNTPDRTPILSDLDQMTLAMLNPAWLPAGEVEALSDVLRSVEFAQHYSSYNKRKSWTAVALRGFSDDPTDIVKPAEMSKSWKAANAGRLTDGLRWTPMADRFPSLMAILRDTGLKFDRVRFMRLRHGDGELSRHADMTDPEAGLGPGNLWRLHCPIATTPAVSFQAWNPRGRHVAMHMPAGSLNILDHRKPHRVYNRDPELDRVHLVMDVVADEKFMAWPAVWQRQPIHAGPAE